MEWLGPWLSLKSSVNCWFCNRGHSVAFAERREWTCPHCEQFNGFAPDGGYSREVPAQHYEELNPRLPPQLRRDSRNDVSDDEEGGNGLCSDCNRKQTLKIAQMTRLDPALDDAALAYARSRLERIHSLCPRCEAAAQQRLRHTHRKLGLPDPKIGASRPRRAEVSGGFHPSPRRRPPISKWAGVGWTCAFLQSLVFALSFMLALGNLVVLEADADRQALGLGSALPSWALEVLNYVHVHGFALSIYALGIHLLACTVNKARLIHADALGALAWLVQGGLFVSAPSQSRLLNLSFVGSLLCLLSLCSLILPRKRIRRSRSKLSGAVSLSVASTPESQATTSFAHSPNSPTHFQPATAASPTPMDVTVSDDEGTFKVPKGPALRKRRSRSPSREATPSRALATALSSGLSLSTLGEDGPTGDDDEDNCSIYSVASSSSSVSSRKRGRGPFPSLSFPAQAPPSRPEVEALFRPASFKAPSSIASTRLSKGAPSVLSEPRFRAPPSSTSPSSSSLWTSVSRQPPNPRWSPQSHVSRPPRSSATNSIASASSASASATSASSLHPLLKATVFIFVAASLLTNVAVLWHIFLKD